MRKVNMKKSLLVATSVAMLIAGGISLAHAAAMHNVPDPACGLLDGNGNVALTSNDKITFTGNANGNATFQCKADVTPADSGGAVKFDFESTGFSCGVPNPADPSQPSRMTQHWEETVSASGNATITCHVP